MEETDTAGGLVPALEVVIEEEEADQGAENIARDLVHTPLARGLDHLLLADDSLSHWLNSKKVLL